MSEPVPTHSPETTGGCLCGTVRYRIRGPLAPGAFCHCSLCRRAGGAPVVAWVTVAADAFALTRGWPRHHHSSPHGRRGFCGDCGTQLTFESTRAPGVIDVTVASLDHPEAHPPDHHVHWPDRLPWLALADDHPRFATDTPAAWPRARDLPGGGKDADPRGPEARRDRTEPE